MGMNYLKLESFQNFTIKYTVQTSLNLIPNWEEILRTTFKHLVGKTEDLLGKSRWKPKF